jgi:hypothetical protein
LVGLAFVGFAGRSGSAYAHEDSDGKVCSNQSLTGTYGIQGSGFLPGPNAMLPFTTGDTQPGNFLNTGIFDGKGHVHGVESDVIGGLPSPDVDYTGTYAVNSDCTGGMTVNGSDSSTFHFKIIVVHNGDKIQLLFTDPGVNGQGTGERVH